jgi:hypothetical protein
MDEDVTEKIFRLMENLLSKWCSLSDLEIYYYYHYFKSHVATISFKSWGFCVNFSIQWLTSKIEYWGAKKI